MILVGIPTTGTVEIQYVNSLMNLVVTSMGLQREIRVKHIENSLVYDARNKIAKQAIDESFEYVLFVDSDMVYNGDALEVLLQTGKDIVSGSIFSRVEPIQPCFYKKLRLGEGTEIICKIATPTDELQEVEGVGTAFLLIKTKVFKDILEKYNTYPFQPINGYGEDLSFCLRARSCGYQIFVQNELTIGHIGKKVFTKNDYKGAENEV